MSKQCSKCKGFGPFGSNRARYDGLKPYCIECTKKNDKKYYKKNKKAFKRRSRKHYIKRAANPGFVRKMRQYSRQYREREDFRRNARISYVRYRHKLSEDQYLALLRKQKNRCAICRKRFIDTPKYRCCVDHCHKTKRVRGLLCHRCNVAIGLLDEDPVRIGRIVGYLRSVR